MMAYIVRRVLYAIPILLGVNILTFVLFFVVNSPQDMARSTSPSTRRTRAVGFSDSGRPVSMWTRRPYPRP